MHSLIPVTTTHLGEHVPLLDLLPDDAPLAWVRNGEGLVGWGVHATTTVSGPHRFADARHWWQKQLEGFAVSNSVHGSGTGPLLFTSFSFSPNDSSVLIIPKIIVGKKGDKSWITWLGSSPQPTLKSEQRIFLPNPVRWNEDQDTDAHWKQRVTDSVQRIHDGVLDKVVLARDFSGTAQSPIDARSILKKLAAEYPSTWSFAVSGLVGATPEL